jgi:hypothetical protein
MRHAKRVGLATLVVLSAAAGVMGADITLDMNGYSGIVASKISGPGLTAPVVIAPGAQKVELKDLKAGVKYTVDLGHNSGVDGSDFTFTVDAKGTGVAKVEPLGKYTAVKAFAPGASTLVLNTFPVVYNANGGQTSIYAIQGMVKATSAGASPVNMTAVPGSYRVDNLFNPGGQAEDFSFIVDDAGKVKGATGFEEYIQGDGSNVNVRTATVRFRVEAAQSLSRRDSHALVGAAVTENLVTQLDMKVPVGGGGFNISSFGPNTVGKSDALDGFGKPLEGRESKNDFHFYPRLRYDVEKQTFYFDTPKGRAQTVFAEVSGMTDSTAASLHVKVTAQILDAGGK